MNYSKSLLVALAAIAAVSTPPHAHATDLIVVDIGGGVSELIRIRVNNRTISSPLKIPQTRSISTRWLGIRQVGVYTPSSAEIVLLPITRAPTR